LSHFSYNHSRGQFLLCDLQGGHYQDSYVLADPVVMSSDKEKRFGALILEAKGLAFFRSSQVQLLLPEYLDEALSSSCFFQNPSSQKYFHESYDWNQEIRGRA
jgi:hypothetical protein